MKKREEDYYRFGKDFILEKLDKQKIDFSSFLNGFITEFKIGRKKYKAFQLKDLKELRGYMMELSRSKFYKEALKEFQENGRPEINKTNRGRREVYAVADERLDKLKTFVIQKFKLKKTIEKQGFVDVLFYNDEYSLVPKKIGRPTDAEKDKRVNLRITGNQYMKLEKLMRDYQLKNISEAVRLLIKRIR